MWLWIYCFTIAIMNDTFPKLGSMCLWLVLRYAAEADSTGIPLHSLQLGNQVVGAKGWKNNLSVHIQD